MSEVRAYAEKFKTVPVSRTLLSDIKTPVEVLQILKKASGHCFMLESLEDPTKWGRYTFLGYDPELEISCADNQLKITGKRGGIEDMVIATGNPARYIRKIIEDNKSPRIEGLPPFTGGLVGYFSYDFIKYGEPALKLRGRDDVSFKDADLMLFDKIIAFDNLKQKITLIVNIRTDDIENNYKNAVDELDKMANLITSGEPMNPEPLRIKSSFRPLFSEEEYCRMVMRAKKYIYEGDVFQVVLSNRLQADIKGSLFDTYRVLRTTNPSPYMFYFSSGDMEISGASPETLVKLTDGDLYTRPLAGTRPRGETDREDQALERELLRDSKELAEHNMLVDLGRNDLGKISKFGSVKVKEYLTVERFSHVMHIASTVRSKIRKGMGAAEAISAVLPAGTLSGAPKMRACQIIDELENYKRGIYGGAIGYLDLTGNMDTCIAIRFALKKNGKVYICAGAGIVADSIPENEYRECVSKSAAVINALKTAENMAYEGRPEI
jgi:anthranilate synthase component 1